MNLGICTRYCFHEATYAGLRIADSAVAHGHDVSILTMTDTPRRVSNKWDAQVRRSRDLKFTKWLQQCDIVLWTSIPHPQQVKYAKKQQRRTCIFVLWHELSMESRVADRAALQAADMVIAPTMAAAQFLGYQWKLDNVVVVPWDVGLPICKKPQDYQPTAPKILMPIYDGVARRVELTALEVAGRALEGCPKASLSVVYNSSTIASPGKRLLKQLKKQFPGRLSLYKGVHPASRPLLFRQHDVTFWPTHWESTCMVGLLSVTMGTPVVTFNCQPMSEMFVNGVHGILVDTSEEKNNIGLPCAAPDYALMDDVFRNDALDTERLYSLQQSVSKGLHLRRETFGSNIRRIFA